MTTPLDAEVAAGVREAIAEAPASASFQGGGVGDPTTGTVSKPAAVVATTSVPVPVKIETVGQDGIEATDWVIYIAGAEVVSKSVPVDTDVRVTVHGRSGVIKRITEFRSGDDIGAYEIRCG